MAGHVACVKPPGLAKGPCCHVLRWYHQHPTIAGLIRCSLHFEHQIRFTEISATLTFNVQLNGTILQGGATSLYKTSQKTPHTHRRGKGVHGAEATSRGPSRSACALHRSGRQGLRCVLASAQLEHAVMPDRQARTPRLQKQPKTRRLSSSTRRLRGFDSVFPGHSPTVSRHG